MTLIIPSHVDTGYDTRGGIFPVLSSRESDTGHCASLYQRKRGRVYALIIKRLREMQE